MITDQLQKCPFCGTKLSMAHNIQFQCLDCPKEKDHQSSTIWVYYYEGTKDISAVNIRHLGYQFCWHIRENETTLFKYDRGDMFEEDTGLKLPCLLNFELTPKNIENKIKTLLLLS